MKIYRTLTTATKTLRRNPLRAMLTTLGIVIGIGSVIAMMEIGEGSSSAVRESIVNMGSNMLIISPGSISSSGVNQGSGSVMSLTPDDCEALKKECPSLRAVTPIVCWSTAPVVYGNKNWTPRRMWGVTAAYFEIMVWGGNFNTSRTFTERDVQTSARICVIGQTVVHELFNGKNPLGKEVRINNVPLIVVGVLDKKGANMFGGDLDDIVVAPWTTVKYRVNGTSSGSSSQSSSSESTSTDLSNPVPCKLPSLYPSQSSTQTKNNPMLTRFKSIDYIMASVIDSNHIQQATDEITAVLRRRHDIQPKDKNDFEVFNRTEMLDMLTSSTKLMTNLLLCVATISLIVGGVGIMNIMLVSVTERTREIGLRMAVGARSRDILQQFLTESVILCLVGGTIGILLGHGGSLLLEFFLKWPVETSSFAIISAVSVAVGIGIIFGFYPAWKAAKLDPIEALRYE
ncbi:MAG TPA: ABC transporter permease [Phycisphaerae bacterium]|nr:ABC transporter permease [Phycisphaerae bacterium]HPS52004.1 ABC transporter permease [Phycisphaerae bacterium]